jgi:hypothetical protein
MTLAQRLDHMHGMSVQLSGVGLKVVYNKSGTLLGAATLDDPRVIVENGAYWAAARSLEEARYLMGILSSTIVLERIAPMQPRGAAGRRHFDKLPWELPVPEYNPQDPLHRELADASEEAERIAARVLLREGAHFTSQRRAIRDALAADGIAGRIDALVARLLDG